MKSVRLTINGRLHQFIVSPDRVLLDILREDLGLTGAKQGCDRKGQCGACTVIVNGKTALSCLVRLSTLADAQVITVEGLGTPENPHLIQEAFVLTGAIQCGYCTPGMIMTAKALLDVNPRPGLEEIKKAFRHNLCRCTGYKKIIEAVELAGRFVRGELTPDAVRPKADGPIMGVSHPRPSSLLKACGTAHFSADIRIQGALELAVLRSTTPHARIVSIDTSSAAKMPGVVGVLTASDIMGTNFLPSERAEVLCRDKVRCIGDPILVVAAITRAEAEAALSAVKIDLEELQPLQSPESAIANSETLVHDDSPNLCYDQPVVKGDARQALQNSAAVVEAKFKTQTNYAAPLEPEASVAYFEDEGEEADSKLVVIGRSIDIHAHLAQIQEAVGWENMSYIEAYCGGQFGIKSIITSEAITAAAAVHFKRPVRYIPSLAESMLMTSKIPAFEFDLKLGADDKGRLTGYDVDVLVDKGAYYFGYGIARALMTLHGSYHIPNIRARGRMVYTNNPFGGPIRGNGQPQNAFALECAIDLLAEKLGIDPFEFRLRNSLMPGETTSTGWVVKEWPFPKVMNALRPHYERAVQEAKLHHNGRIKRGVGLAAGAHGVARTGEIATAAVALEADGGITVFTAAADPGEGNDSMLTQLTAKVMNIPLKKIRLNTRNTDNTAASGPAAGSRVTYMMGGALLDALKQLKTVMEQEGARTSEDLIAAGKSVRYVGRRKNEKAPPMDPVTGQGPGFLTEIHGVQLVELDVDTLTGEVIIQKITSAADCGSVIHPQNVTGQLEGGMDMGAGYALREIYVAGKTKDWITFKFPNIQQSFEMETIIVETVRATGTLGATGIGEMSMVPTAPAVINAIRNAAGIMIFELPATPDKIKAALAAGQG